MMAILKKQSSGYFPLCPLFATHNKEYFHSFRDQFEVEKIDDLEEEFMPGSIINLENSSALSKKEGRKNR